MLENNVLKKDAISNELAEYAERIGDPNNKVDHRPFFQEALERFFDHHDEFYTETNLKNGKITWAYGLNNWLGHEDLKIGEDPNDVLVNFVHPMLRDWYAFIVQAMPIVFAAAKIELNYLQSRFCISVPMRDKRGNLYLVKQMAMVFGMEMDMDNDKKKDNKVVSFINSFSIFGPYHNEPLNLQFFEGKNKFKKKVEKEMLSSLADLFYKCIDIDPSSGFSLTPDDFLVLDIIRDLRNEGQARDPKEIKKRYEKHPGKIELKDAAIPKRLARIHKDLKWILNLDKGIPDVYFAGKDKIYRPEFNDVYELADFLEQSGIIFIIRQYLQRRKFEKK